MIEESMIRYQEKIGYGSSHKLLRENICRLPAGTKVLDVGVSNGLLGRMCTDSEFSIYGIEPNEFWARLAEPYYIKIYIGDLGEVPDDYLQDFDVIVCADVLEHMAYPEQQLRRLVYHQKKGTLFFVSVPNIANIWIRLNLLFGRFEYTERGILDNTHLRFFTRKSFQRLLEGSGLKVAWITPTPIPLELVHSFFRGSLFGKLINILLLLLTKLFPTLLGYQFFARAFKENDSG